MQERFTRELAALRALAREVGERFPEIAHLVAGRAADPSVERIFQASALILGRVGERVEGDLPELMHPYVESLWPEEVRPRPPVTLLSGRLEDGQSATIIPAGTRVQARVEGGEVSFATTDALELFPIEIESVNLARPDAAALEVVVRFHLFGGADVDGLELERLRLHVLGEPAERGVLFAWLTHQLVEVRVRSLDGRAIPLASPLRARPLSTAGQAPVWPVGPLGLTPLSRLETFFSFPDALYGLELDGLGALRGHELGDGFELAFVVRGASGRELTPTTANLALWTVPALNLGESERVDVEIPGGRTEVRVSAPRDGEVYALDRVGAYARRTGEWMEFRPLLDARGGRPAAGQICFEAQRRAEDLRPGDLHLRITDLDGRPQSPPADRIAVWLTATESGRALGLGADTITIPAPGSTRQASFRNPIPVRPGASSAINRGRLFERVALSTGPRAELLTEAGLRRLLKEAMVSPGDLPERLVRKLEVTRGSFVARRLVRPSLDLLLELDDRAFSGLGELYLFALVLRDALAGPGYTQLEVHGRDSGVVLKVGTAD